MRAPALILGLLGLLAAPLFAEMREWKSADGRQSFNGEYVSHDSKKVTIRREDGKVFTLEFEKLNDADKIWLSDKPVTESPAPAEKGKTPAVDESKAVFDTLCFGDTREVVAKKLKESSFVEGTIDEVMMGRTGLNGVFRTRKQIGGLHCELYFDFSSGGGLKEISLQTQTVPKEVYVNRLKATWQELAELLTALNGKPEQAGSFPAAGSLREDVLIPSHLWKLPNNGSVRLGTSLEAGDKVMIVVRFSTDPIKAMALP